MEPKGKNFEVKKKGNTPAPAKKPSSRKRVYKKRSEKRMSDIFRSMSNLSRLEILRVLYTKGSTSYTDLKSFAGFATKRESGKFAYHLRDLSDLALVELNKSERQYNITNQGKIVLTLADKITANAFTDSGKLQVRSSNSSIDEFKKQRIVQSLVTEGNMPYELAEKITREVENKIHKYDISYITGSLIREMVNYVLLETSNEEYRDKLVRLGMPIYDVQQMLSDVDRINGGMDELVTRAGQSVFTESVLFGTLQKDMADKHMSGAVHMSNLGTWSTLPDVLFVNVKEMLDADGLNPGDKHASVSRIPKIQTLENVTASLSILINLLIKEVSEEVVMAGLPQLLAKKCADKTDDEIIRGLVQAFLISSASAPTAASSYAARDNAENGNGKNNDDSGRGRGAANHANAGSTPESSGVKITSIRLGPGSDERITNCIIAAYAEYARLTPKPRIGLIIGYDKDKIGLVSEMASKIVLYGGNILFTRSAQVSSRGIAGGGMGKADSTMSMALQSVSVNLPGLAHEIGDNDEPDFFITRLIMLLKPVMHALAARKRDVFETTRRGLNPLIAKNTQHMQRGHASMTINLVGMQEAIFDILGFSYNRLGREFVQKLLTNIVDMGKTWTTDSGAYVTVCMRDSDGAGRLARLDGKRHGKQVMGPGDTKPYAQGLEFDAAKLSSYTTKSPSITLCNKISRILSAGLQVRLRIPKGESDACAVKDAIEKMASLVPSFAPVKDIVICAECGFKDRPFESRCPRCHAPLRTI